jgi:hypothetical protein
MKDRPSRYSRPAKPLFVPVPKRDWLSRSISAGELPTPIAVDVNSECHVTPHDVASRMADLIGDLRAVDVLEPSAGTGNLAKAVLAAGCDRDRLTLVELHTRLASGLQGLGKVECADFLEWARTAPKFGAIIMNPPFSRVKAHMAAAASLLAPGGTLVALVPVTFDGLGFEEYERLPVDTFSAAKVHTKIVIREA